MKSLVEKRGFFLPQIYSYVIFFKLIRENVSLISQMKNKFIFDILR